MPKKRSKKTPALWGYVILLLFALPFAGVGVFMGYRFASSIAVWQSAKSWEETAATLRRLELKRSSGDDGDTYQVVAEYDYTYGGRPYHSKRVGLFSGSDNVSSYAHKLHDRLKRDRARGNVNCYVNPGDPEQALLDRQMRLGMLVFHVPFVLTFGGFGFGALGYGLTSTLQSGKAKQLARQHPDEPWLWRADWRRGVILQSQSHIAAWACAAVLWNSVCGATLVVGLSVDEPGSIVFLLILALNLVGLGLLLQAARVLFRRWRYGVSEFQLASTPGVIGGRLAGVVNVPGLVDPADGFTAKLICQEQQTTSSGGESSTSQVTIFEDERQITRTLDSGDPRKTCVPIMFTVPSAAKQTAPEDDWPVTWKLEIHASTRGPDYKASFDAPVFLTEDSQEGVTLDESPESDYETELTLEALLARDRIRVDVNTPQELQLTEPVCRFKKTAVLSLLFAALCLGGGAYLLAEVDLIPAVFAWLFSLISLAVGVNALLVSSHLAIVGDNWDSLAGWYGFRRSRRFERDAIRRIVSDTVMSSSSGNGAEQQWNRLVAHLEGGEKATLLCSITDRILERRLLAELRSRAGIDEPKGNANGREDADDRWQRAMDLPAEDA